MPSPTSAAACRLVAAVLVCHAAAAGAQNLVANGTFSTGTFAGYTTASQFYAVGPGVSGTGYAAESGALTSAPAVLTQALATTPGQQYTVSFYALNVQPGGTQNFLRVLFGGVTLFDRPIVSGAYQQFSLLSAPVVGSTTDLTFLVANDPGATFLDDISVTAFAPADAGSGPTTVTPEPATLALTAGGLAALAVGARARRRSA